MTAFPSLWSVIDEPTGRIICELDNPMVDPGDGTIISATNISIITYAGDGQWCRQEDIYNPLRFVSATMKWCRKAQELGTLPDEAASWMRQYGGSVSAAPSWSSAPTASSAPTSPANWSPTARTCGSWCGRGANTIGIDDLDVHAVRRRHLRHRHPARGDGRLR